MSNMEEIMEFKKTMKVSNITHKKLRLRAAELGLPIQLLADFYLAFGLEELNPSQTIRFLSKRRVR